MADEKKPEKPETEAARVMGKYAAVIVAKRDPEPPKDAA
jgi:hypothetical protein